MLGISWLLSVRRNYVAFLFNYSINKSSLQIVAATWLLLGCSTNAKVFKRIETGCKQNNVECLGVDTYTYCLNRSAGSYLLKFVFNCPKNYVCDETARYP